MCWGFPYDVYSPMKVIEKKLEVTATPDKVWQAWTTNDGVRSFFAPDSDIELAIGGKYEIFFNHTKPYGEKGSEGCKVLSYVPERMLSFSWNAPPAISALRQSGEKTWVVVEIEPTLVKLWHFIPKEGGDWDNYYNYFDRAWGVVLENLGSYLVSGPLNWEE